MTPSIYLKTRWMAGWRAYDWDAVAERARENGREDWARAFLG
jgi:hypothetical protein